MTRIPLLALAVAAAAAVSPAAPRAEDLPLTRADVETIVRAYLLENPQILEEMVAILQSARQEQAEAALVPLLAEHRDALEKSPGDPVLGNPEGDVTLVEFFDYNCGYCRRAFDDVNRLLEADPDLRVVMKEFPVLGEGSREAAEVSLAVNAVAPESYFEFHRRLLGRPGEADGAAALAIVEEMGLPTDAVVAELREGRAGTTVEQTYELAARLGFSGTPTYVVGDRVEFGRVGFDDLRASVNRARCGADLCS